MWIVCFFLQQPVPCVSNEACCSPHDAGRNPQNCPTRRRSIINTHCYCFHYSCIAYNLHDQFLGCEIHIFGNRWSVSCNRLLSDHHFLVWCRWLTVQNTDSTLHGVWAGAAHVPHTADYATRPWLVLLATGRIMEGMSTTATATTAL